MSAAWLSLAVLTNTRDTLRRCIQRIASSSNSRPNPRRLALGSTASRWMYPAWLARPLIEKAAIRPPTKMLRDRCCGVAAVMSSRAARSLDHCPGNDRRSISAASINIAGRRRRSRTAVGGAVGGAVVVRSASSRVRVSMMWNPASRNGAVELGNSAPVRTRDAPRSRACRVHSSTLFGVGTMW